MSKYRSGRYSEFWIPAAVIVVVIGVAMYSDDTVSQFVVWNTVGILITAAATVGLLFAAFKALNTWKRQVVGEAGVKLLQSLIEATFELRNAIDIFRIGLHPEESEEKGYETANYERLSSMLNAKWKKLDHAFARFESLRLQAQIILPDHDISASRDVLLIRADMFEASRDLLNFRNPNWPQGDKEKLSEEMPKTYAVLMSIVDQSGYNQEIKRRLNAFLKQVKSIYVELMEG